MPDTRSGGYPEFGKRGIFILEMLGIDRRRLKDSSSVLSRRRRKITVAFE